MADPVLGKNALIYLYKGGDYFLYMCDASFTMELEKDTVSTKTIGDGNWERNRASKNRYSISLEGVIKLDAATDPYAFDLVDAFMGDTDIPFRIKFTETETSLQKIIEGNGLPVNISMGGAAEGFAEANFTLKGNGQPTITDSIATCSATLGTFTAVGDSDSAGVVNLNFTTGVSSDCVRIEWSVDGGDRDVFFPPATGTPFLHSLTSVAPGSHSIEFFPMCENTLDGISQTKSVTVI